VDVIVVDEVVAMVEMVDVVAMMVGATAVALADRQMPPIQDRPAQQWLIL
jgi:hypothetical protein